MRGVLKTDGQIGRWPSARRMRGSGDRGGTLDPVSSIRVGEETDWKEQAATTGYL